MQESVNMKFSEVHDPNGICKDITGIGRWGNRDVELYMEHTYEVDQMVSAWKLKKTIKMFFTSTMMILCMIVG